MTVAIRILLAGLLLAACVGTQPYYWTKQGASEDQFVKSSRACRFEALKQVGPPARGTCTVVRGGQYCREYNDFEKAQVEDEQQRRVQRFYGSCMEERGWASNHEGEGFHQKYGSKPPPEKQS